MSLPAAGEPEGFVWKESLDILDKWDYTLHWTAIALATIDLESVALNFKRLLRQANSCGGSPVNQSPLGH